MMWERLWEMAYSLHNDWPECKSALRQLVSNVRAKGDTTTEARLLRAYLAYHFPCEETSDIEIEKELGLVLSADKLNSTAQLYLSHFYFDREDFSNALTHLQAIDLKIYKNASQNWRVLKIQELMLSCRLHLQPSAVQPAELLEFVENLRKAGIDEAALPVELVNALLKNKSQVEKIWLPEHLNEVQTAIQSAICESGGSDILSARISQIST